MGGVKRNFFLSETILWSDPLNLEQSKGLCDQGFVTGEPTLRHSGDSSSNFSEVYDVIPILQMRRLRAQRS